MMKSLNRTCNVDLSFLRAMKPLLLIVSMGIVSVSAQAGSVTIGTITASTPGSLGTITSGSTLFLGDTGLLVNPTFLSNSSTTATKTFYDDFVFTVPVGESITAISASLNNTATTFAGISGFTESLYSGQGSITTGYSSTTNPFTGSVLASNGSLMSAINLGAGTYTLQFSGTLAQATSVLGTTVPSVGTFVSTVAIATAAIPEPSTYALMFAGLGIAGLAARRRKAQ